MSEKQNRLIANFADTKYAHSYMGSHTVSKIAAQVYWTRKKRGWTQGQLAKRSDMAQERISKIESGEFSSLTMKTLSKLAEALDVNLRIEFEQFSHGVINICNQSKSTLELPDRTSSLKQLQQSLGVVTGPNGLPPVIVSGSITHATAQTRGLGGPITINSYAVLIPQIEGSLV